MTICHGTSAWDGRDFSDCLQHKVLEVVPSVIAFTIVCSIVTRHLIARHYPTRIEIVEQTDTARRAEDNVISSFAQKEQSHFDQVLGLLPESLPKPALSADSTTPAGLGRSSKAKAFGIVFTGSLVLLLVARACILPGYESWLTTISCAIISGAALVVIYNSNTYHMYYNLFYLLYNTSLLFTIGIQLRSSLMYHNHADRTLIILHTAILAIVVIQTLHLLFRPSGPRQTFGDSAPPEYCNPSLFSTATVGYFDRVVMAASKTLGAIETPSVRPDATPATALHAFRMLTAQHPSWSLKARLFWYFKAHLLHQQILTVFSAFLNLAPAFFLKLILQYLSDPGKTTRDVALTYGVLMAACNLLGSIFSSRALLIGRHMAVKFRAVAGGELFAKVLRQRETTQLGKSGSSISNLISVDVFRVSEVGAYLHFIFPDAFITITFGVFLLFRTLGLSALAGLAAILVHGPVVSMLGKLYKKYSTQLLDASDKRLHLVQEVIQAIRIVKFFAWQSSFDQRLRQLRQDELKQLWKRQAAETFMVALLICGSLFTAAITFFVHTVILGRTLDAATAFTSIALLYLIRAPVDAFSHLLISVLQANVSLTRIQDYLDTPETEKWSILGEDQDKIGFEHASFTWHVSGVSGKSKSKTVDETEAQGEEATEDVFSLGELNVTFPNNKLSLIVGPVGSGKTTLLLSLLGETQLVKGRVFLPSPLHRDEPDPSFALTEATAYCAQSAYLISDTVKNNIVFGSAWNEERYYQVLEACALLPDISSFDQGDEQEVGERGTVLSGGQKARIALARALYSPAKYLLLDDVIAAVDVHTARKLLRTLTGPLMQGRTCILVTHALSIFLPASDYIIALDQGRVIYSGTPDQAIPLLDQLEGEHQELNVAEDHELAAKVTDPVDNDTFPKSVNALVKSKGQKKADHSEEQKVGAVDPKVYSFYFGAIGNLWVWASIILLYIACQTSEVATNAWLKQWAASYQSNMQFSLVLEQAKLAAHTMVENTSEATMYYFKRYALLCGLTVLLTTCRLAWYLSRGIGAAQTIYDGLMQSVMGARVKFFDTTPVGRIMNRLSRDTQVIDQDISDKTSFAFLEVFWVAAIIVAIFQGVPWFLLLVAVMGGFYAKITTLYLKGSREFKRTESTTRSPIFSLFGETLNGVVTIRAFSDTTRFLNHYFELQDINSRPFYALWMANRWLALRTDIASSISLLFVATFLVASDDMDPALAGFCLSYAITLQERLLWCARLYAEIEIEANSIERIQEYLELDQEPTDGIVPDKAWPSQSGKIKVEGLTASYAADASPVLQDVSFVIEPKEKVAIVGRTGSGKSTLALCFFRFLESMQGKIVIDNIDISTVELNHLRSRLTIIPQDATLFSGTIRFNLDPFNRYADLDLWDALRRVQLVTQTPTTTPRPSRPGSVVKLSALSTIETESSTLVDEEETRTVIRSLDQVVAEGGKNFSAGQRQLLALARGLLKLKESRILILDEASASLDSKTDEHIQETIRSEMRDATILCIAHRLSTIIDYDKVLVLDHGHVLEYDSPWNLLQQTDSAFAKLCQSHGETEYQKLSQLAREAQDAREQH